MIAPFGIPFEFILFGLMLLGVALFHRRALAISVVGLLVIFAFETFITAYPTGRGADALLAHASHEWVTIVNLFLLLVGFELLSNQFERSNLSDHLPNLCLTGSPAGSRFLPSSSCSRHFSTISPLPSSAGSWPAISIAAA